MKQFGLIGSPLSHSFSKKYFTKKFENQGITDCQYDLFPLENMEDLPALLRANPSLVGLNVTIPYKEKVLAYLEEIDEAAAEIGAVNTIRIRDGKLKGFNTDVYGFEVSLQKFLQPISKPIVGLILGTGGAAKAVAYVLQKMNIPYQYVSRKKQAERLNYTEITPAILDENRLIINTTPLGMSPNTETFPTLPYEYLTNEHFLYDLVYNPEQTAFMQLGTKQGAATKNGLEMLHLQAEKAWEIWNKNS